MYCLNYFDTSVYTCIRVYGWEWQTLRNYRSHFHFHILFNFFSQVAVPQTHVVKPCDDICACVTPMVTEFRGKGGISFEIDGNRFHLQKLLHELTPGPCHYNVTVPKDAVYFECLDRSAICASSRLVSQILLKRNF